MAHLCKGCATEYQVSVAHAVSSAPQNIKFLWRTQSVVRHRISRFCGAPGRACATKIFCAHLHVGPPCAGLSVPKFRKHTAPARTPPRRPTAGRRTTTAPTHRRQPPQPPRSTSTVPTRSTSTARATRSTATAPRRIEHRPPPRPRGAPASPAPTIEEHLHRAHEEHVHRLR